MKLLVLENTAEALCKGYIYRTTFGIQTKKSNLVRIKKFEDIKHRSFK